MLTNLIIIAGILIISLIGFNMTKHSFSVLEGMVDRKKKEDSDIVDIVTIAKNQADITKTAVDNLNRKEHGKHYSEIIGNLTLWTTAKMLDQTKILSHKLSTKAEMSEITKMMSDINVMYNFRTSVEALGNFGL
jgi:predicted CopG family antitoxin